MAQPGTFDERAHARDDLGRIRPSGASRAPARGGRDEAGSHREHLSKADLSGSSITICLLQIIQQFYSRLDPRLK